MEKQLFGSEAPLTKNSPLNYEQDARSRMAVETGASEVDLDRRPFSLNPINAGCGNPEKQFFGSEAPLNRTPQHGWESANTPMSNRTRRQSE